MFYQNCTLQPNWAPYETAKVNSVSYSAELWGKGPKRWCTVCKKYFTCQFVVSFLRVCQHSDTVRTLSDKSPTELSFKSLHNIVHFIDSVQETDGDLCAEIELIVFCFMFSLHLYQAMIILQIQKKSRKRCTSFSCEIFLSEMHLPMFLVVCSCQSCLSAYIQPFMNGRWKLWSIVHKLEYSERGKKRVNTRGIGSSTLLVCWPECWVSLRNTVVV